MTASLADDDASAERRIQELTKELSLARGELAEVREQRTATVGILAAISSSPADLRRVCAEIAANAARPCGAYDAVIGQVDGNSIRLVAHRGPGPTTAPVGQSTMRLTRGVTSGRAILDRQTIHVADLQAEMDEYPQSLDLARQLGIRTVLVHPLMREDVAIGVIGMRRTEVRPFTEKQIELLKLFADQAVIAIENTRLVEELQTRRRERTESLDYQTATSDVLEVISRSPTGVQPVLETITTTGARLCEAEYSILFNVTGDHCRVAASNNASAEYVKYLVDNPVPLNKVAATARAALEARTVHIHDVLAWIEWDHEYRETQRLGRQRTVLSVPLIRDGRAVGVLTMMRSTVRPFGERQIKLAEPFADQAVIAIENTRLFEAEQASKCELQESLEYQTATSEVLNVISRSNFELEPVFSTIVETAGRLCHADFAIVLRLGDDGKYHLAASYGYSPEFLAYVERNPLTVGRATVVGRVALEGRTVHVTDVLADPDYGYQEGQRLGGYRTALGVPPLSGGKPIGALALSRSRAKPHTEKQIEPVETFADQAVIAIENTRLFEAEQTRTRELTERTRALTRALEYQTATSDVLAAISRSKFELQPVLDVIASITSRLCVAD